ncbi:MAG: deoxyribodipyrimidine photo-lyase, partial [Burkholderiales bacterium]
MKSVLFWFRRDLRVADNAGLYHALQSGIPVYCAFIFDRDILDKLPSKSDRRVEFIWESLQEVHQRLVANGGGLIVRHASAKSEIPKLAGELGVSKVYANDDYEPAAIARDRDVSTALRVRSIDFEVFKDTVIFEKNEVLTQAGKPFSVFTPYKNAWLKKLSD